MKHALHLTTFILATVSNIVVFAALDVSKIDRDSSLQITTALDVYSYEKAAKDKIASLQQVIKDNTGRLYSHVDKIDEAEAKIAKYEKQLNLFEKEYKFKLSKFNHVYSPYVEFKDLTLMQEFEYKLKMNKAEIAHENTYKFEMHYNKAKNDLKVVNELTIAKFESKKFAVDKMREKVPNPKDLREWTINKAGWMGKPIEGGKQKVESFLRWMERKESPLRTRYDNAVPMHFGDSNWGISVKLNDLMDEVDLKIVQEITESFELAKKWESYEFLNERLKIWERYNDKMKGIHIQKKLNIIDQFDVEYNYHILTKEMKITPTEKIRNMYKELEKELNEIENKLNQNPLSSKEIFEKRKGTQNKISDMLETVHEKFVQNYYKGKAAIPELKGCPAAGLRRRRSVGGACNIKEFTEKVNSKETNSYKKKIVKAIEADPDVPHQAKNIIKKQVGNVAEAAKDGAQAAKSAKSAKFLKVLDGLGFVADAAVLAYQIYDAVTVCGKNKNTKCAKAITNAILGSLVDVGCFALGVATGGIAAGICALGSALLVAPFVDGMFAAKDEFDKGVQSIKTGFSHPMNFFKIMDGFQHFLSIPGAFVSGMWKGFKNGIISLGKSIHHILVGAYLPQLYDNPCQTYFSCNDHGLNIKLHNGRWEELRKNNVGKIFEFSTDKDGYFIYKCVEPYANFNPLSWGRKVAIERWGQLKATRRNQYTGASTRIIYYDTAIGNYPNRLRGKMTFEDGYFVLTRAGGGDIKSHAQVIR